MSSDKKEEAPKITSEKPEDPRRVEAGKRLAAISKQAKERKLRERMEAERVRDDGGSPNSNYLIGGLGLLIGVASLYYNYKDDKRNEAKKEEPVREEKTVEVTKVLDSLE